MDDVEMPQALMSEDQVAEYLQVPSRTLRQWRYLDEGPPYVKVGPKHIRYRWPDVEHWVLNRAHVPVQ